VYSRACRLTLAAAMPSALAMASVVGAGTASAQTAPSLTLSPSSGSWSTTFSLNPADSGQCASNANSYVAYIIASSKATSENAIFANGVVLGTPGGNSVLGSLPGNKVLPALSANFADSGASVMYNVTAGQFQIGVQCFEQPAETVTNDFFTTITFSGAGTKSPSWTSSSSSTPPPSPVATTTTLSVSPASPAASGSQETLTATVAAASGSAVPAGSVEFMDGSADLASGTVSSSGVATGTANLADGSHSLTAVFTPSDSTAFSSSTSAAVSYTVNQASTGGSPGPGSETVTVTIPSAAGGGQGQLTLTVPPNAADSLTVNSAGTSAVGYLAPVDVSDTRASSPGWTVSGQASDFTGSAGTIPGDDLGWTPDVVTSVGPVAVGPAVAPGDPGLGSAAAVLGNSTGDSTASLGAQLNLAIPSGQASGIYNSTITITAI
jgi:hypothetical protein